ncbi:MFS transporter [Furfurilactobacillus entadae]|uniref:MFS transporter n=1 Tax=Furfurilactobacillus entadae TaxID=2922307 RepID=UPI0035EEFA12
MMTDVKHSALKKVTRHILPYLFVIYFIAFLDRSSITYASIGGLDKDLGLTAAIYGFIAGIFFIGYFLFGIPGNMMLEKIGARRWLAFILVFWGAITLATGFVTSISALVVLRFLLGVSEAGLFPGMTLYITYWIRSRDRARAIAAFMVAPPVANAIGAPIATWIITQVHMAFGLEGWRWLFIIIGIPAILMGVYTVFFLADVPASAKWLTTDEKQWLITALADDVKQEEKKTVIKAPFVDAFKDAKIWKMTGINFFYCIGLYGITFWMPQMVKSLAGGLTTMQVGLISAIPYLLGAVALVVNGQWSDRSGERVWHTAGGALIGGIGFVGAALTTAVPIVSVGFICLSAIGVYAYSGPYWAITTTVDPRIAAVGLGIVNAVGNFGGFFGPYAIGWLKGVTHSTTTGMYFLAASLIIAGVFVLSLRAHHSEESATTKVTTDSADQVN